MITCPESNKAQRSRQISLKRLTIASSRCRARSATTFIRRFSLAQIAYWSRVRPTSFSYRRCPHFSAAGTEELSDAWTLTPVGGSGRIPTFVRLLTGQKGITVATLIDVQSNDRDTIEGLYRDKLLKKTNVRTFADYTGNKEADIEDMFEPDFYLSLINAEYRLAPAITLTDLTSKAPRVLVRLEEYRKSSGLLPTFSHYRPARYFHEKLDALAAGLSASTKERFAKAFADLNKLLE